MSWLQDLQTAGIPAVVYVPWEAADDMPNTVPHVPLASRRGKEANAYLRFIVDPYDSLPDVTAFVHGHK